MKKFNFAFFSALFLCINGWVFLKAPKELLFLSATLTLPLIFAAFSSLKVNYGVKANNRPSLLSSTLPAYLAAFFISAAFILFVFKKAHPGTFFFEPRIEGWSYIEGLTLLVLNAGIAACGVSIWAGRKAYENPEDSSLSSRIFLFGHSATTRIMFFFTVIIAAYIAGGASVLALHPSRTWFGLLVVTGRCAIPLVFILIGSLLLFPVLPFALVSAAASAYLFKINTNTKESIIFLSVGVLVLFIYSFIASKVKKPDTMTIIPQIPPKPETDKVEES